MSLAVPIACAVLVLLLSASYELRKHIEHRSLFGKVRAAGGGGAGRTQAQARGR